MTQQSQLSQKQLLATAISTSEYQNLFTFFFESKCATIDQQQAVLQAPDPNLPDNFKTPFKIYCQRVKYHQAQQKNNVLFENENDDILVDFSQKNVGQLTNDQLFEEWANLELPVKQVYQKACEQVQTQYEMHLRNRQQNCNNQNKVAKKQNKKIDVYVYGDQVSNKRTIGKDFIKYLNLIRKSLPDEILHHKPTKAVLKPLKDLYQCFLTDQEHATLLSIANSHSSSIFKFIQKYEQHLRRKYVQKKNATLDRHLLPSLPKSPFAIYKQSCLNRVDPNEKDLLEHLISQWTTLKADTRYKFEKLAENSQKFYFKELGKFKNHLMEFYSEDQVGMQFVKQLKKKVTPLIAQAIQDSQLRDSQIQTQNLGSHLQIQQKINVKVNQENNIKRKLSDWAWMDVSEKKQIIFDLLGSNKTADGLFKLQGQNCEDLLLTHLANYLHQLQNDENEQQRNKVGNQIECNQIFDYVSESQANLDKIDAFSALNGFEDKIFSKIDDLISQSTAVTTEQIQSNLEENSHLLFEKKDDSQLIDLDIPIGQIDFNKKEDDLICMN